MSSRQRDRATRPDPGLSLNVPPGLLDSIAVLVADRIADRLDPPPAEGYLDTDSAAEYLACPKSRIYELTAAGRLRHYRDGRRVLFRRKDLDAVLETREIEGE